MNEENHLLFAPLPEPLVVYPDNILGENNDDID
jgi:hypothetical protein